MSKIPNVPRKVVVLNSWGDTADIMTGLMTVVDRDWPVEQVKDFAADYRAYTPEKQYQQCRKLWRVVRDDIRYEQDPEGVQDLKHPARTWAERRSVGADCKSKSIFIYYCLRALDIPCFLRFASYWDKASVEQARREGKEVSVGQIGHVYPVAIIGGRCVPMDAVYHRYDAELRAVKVKDRFPKAWDTPEVRSLAAQSRRQTTGTASVGKLPEVPRWANGGIAVLSGIQFFRAETFTEKIIYAGLGWYFGKKAIA